MFLGGYFPLPTQVLINPSSLAFSMLAYSWCTGMSVSYVARLLGHENLSSTQVYLHPSQDDAIEEVRKVEFFLGPGSNGTGWYGPVGI